MYDYPSSRSDLLSKNIPELLNNEMTIIEQIKESLNNTVSAETETSALCLKKFRFLMDLYYLKLSGDDFFELLNLLKGKVDGKEVDSLKNEILSRRFDIEDAYNISIAKELSIVFGCLIINSLVRYYNLYMVNAITFVFLSSVIQLASIMSSLMIGYQITAMMGAYINQNCFAQEKSKIKFSSIVGSVHFENYFICTFGKSFYDSLNLTKYEFEGTYYAENTPIFNDFKDVIAARKSILYKYSYYQKCMETSNVLQRIFMHRKVGINMAAEFSGIKLPEDVKDFQFLESDEAKKIWKGVASVILRRDNFDSLLNECKTSKDYQKFICMLYDSCMQYHAELDLEELYVLSELVNQSLFPNYISPLNRSHLHSDNSVEKSEGEDESHYPFKLHARDFVYKKALNLFESRSGSIERLIFSFGYLYDNQKDCLNAYDEKISNTINALLIDKEKSSYLNTQNSESVYKKFTTLSKCFNVRKHSNGASSDAHSTGGKSTNNSDSLSHLLMNNLRSVCASEKYTSENKTAFIKSTSTCMLGITVYGISNTFMINFALTAMSIYIAYEGVVIIAGRDKVNNIIESVIGYSYDRSK